MMICGGYIMIICNTCLFSGIFFFTYLKSYVSLLNVLYGVGNKTYNLPRLQFFFWIFFTFLNLLFTVSREKWMVTNLIKINRVDLSMFISLN